MITCSSGQRREEGTRDEIKLFHSSVSPPVRGRISKSNIKREAAHQ